MIRMRKIIVLFLVLFVLLASCGKVNTKSDTENTERIIYDIPDPVITADYAEDVTLKGDYHHFIYDDSPYKVQVLFRAYDEITDVSLFAIIIGEREGEREYIYHLDTLDAKKPLLADLGFPGDMSSYGISFRDRNGEEHIYAISQSGMDGSLVTSDYPW